MKDNPINTSSILFDFIPENLGFKPSEEKAFSLLENDGKRIFLSPNYSSLFNTRDGYFLRWGSSFETNDDPKFCEFGPELLDIEISSGHCRGGCEFCYKGNTPSLPVEYMPLKAFKTVFEKVHTPVLTQIAFGITDIDANPDMWEIFDHCRKNGIIPNYTTNGIGVTSEVAQRTHDLCGAVAVSVYAHTKEKAYDAIKAFTDTGMTQVNIHFMLAQETLFVAEKVLFDMKNDPRLSKMNAIVFLQYKDKNPGPTYTNPTMAQFKRLVGICMDDHINFGFDSCSSSMFIKSVVDRPDSKRLIEMVDNCESGLFSFYINVKREAFPCSFLEGIDNWEKGIDVLSCEKFVDDIWNGERVVEWRNKLLGSSKNCNCAMKDLCRSCFTYKINGCKE